MSKVCWLCMLTLAACGASVPEPRMVEQPAGAYQTVPYPPPAAFVELVPKAPDDEAVWVDGSWTWQGQRYLWRRGGWVKPPAGAHYAPWQLDYRTDGTIWFAPAAWWDAQGRKLEDPEPVRPATTPPNEITAEELQSGR